MGEAMKSGFHAFRVAVPRKPTGNEPGGLEKKHLTRRPHNKSRGGCEGCRQRRKKCNELRPACSFCVQRGIVCNYNRRPPRPSAAERALVMALATPVPALWPVARSPPLLTDTRDTRHTEHDLYLIHHFTHATAPAFGSADHGGVYANQALELAKEYPFLMHAMIALAACHLQHVGIDARQYRKAEALHCHFASQGLRTSVSRPIRGVHDSDAILTAAMLLNTLTFCAAEYREEEGMSIGTGREPRYEWLRIQIGLTELLARTSPFHPESVWIFLFMATKNFQFEEPPHNELDRELAEFCGIDGSSTWDNNVYFDLIERLSPVVVRPPSKKYMMMYLNAIGGISPKIVDLLEAKETRALLLFAHLLSLLCSIDQWWCVKRTRRECRKVCSILSGRLDRRLLYLLERPAETCGFPLGSKYGGEDLSV